MTPGVFSRSKLTSLKKLIFSCQNKKKTLYLSGENLEIKESIRKQQSKMTAPMMVWGPFFVFLGGKKNGPY